MVSGKPLGLGVNDYALHHVVPFSKIYHYSKPLNNWTEIAKTVPLTNKEHRNYHNLVIKDYGFGRDYPSPVNWVNHFCRWAVKYREENGIDPKSVPNGAFGRWEALNGCETRESLEIPQTVLRFEQKRRITLDFLCDLEKKIQNSQAKEDLQRAYLAVLQEKYEKIGKF